MPLKTQNLYTQKKDSKLPLLKPSLLTGVSDAALVYFKLMHFIPSPRGTFENEVLGSMNAKYSRARHTCEGLRSMF